MTREESIEQLKWYFEYDDGIGADKETVESYKIAIKALEQEPCEDAVSRQIISDYVQSHIQEINAGYGDLNEHTNRILRMIVAYIETMSSVTPQPKTGHWIRWYEQKEKDCVIENIPHCKCSECGKEYDPHSSQFIKYCNECGAKMQEVKGIENSTGKGH